MRVILVPRSQVRLRSRSRGASPRHLVHVDVLNAMTGRTLHNITVENSWSVSDLRIEIARLRRWPASRQKEIRLVFETRILEDQEIVEHLCKSGRTGSDHKLEVSLVEVLEDFYVRYFAKMVVERSRDQEFQEFEFCGDGRFRFARNFLQRGFFEGKQQRKEIFLSPGSLQVLKNLILKSGILEMDDSQWQAPTKTRRQEIEIKCDGHHVVFATTLRQSMSHVDAGLKLADKQDMSEFDALAEDIKAFGKSILNIFGVIRSS
eukprot:symbB.v1.2.013878.t1/scaffold991.1/size149480/13